VRDEARRIAANIVKLPGAFAAVEWPMSIGAVGGLFQSGAKFGATEANFNRILNSE